jgi:hypothetical protein
MPGGLIVTAPNGVRWRRSPGGSSTPAELFAAMELLTTDWHQRQWNWWRQGQIEATEGKARGVWREWEHAEPPPGGYRYEGSTEEVVTAMEAEWEAQRAERERTRLARQEKSDEEQSKARITMLQNQANAGFMRHVLGHPASAAQRAKAEEKLAKYEQEAARLAAQVSDPDEVPDRHGDLPPDRRTWHLSSLTAFRHGLLRELDERRQRQRFRTVLAMPALDAADMCSECEAPANWHTWNVSLCLYRGKPDPGSQAETIARLLPGWWERCQASTTYQLCHIWGLDPLPDFDGEQWVAMLPPLLRAWFAVDGKPKRQPIPRKDSRTALERQLRQAEAQAEELRRQIASLPSQRDGDDDNAG